MTISSSIRSFRRLGAVLAASAAGVGLFALSSADAQTLRRIADRDDFVASQIVDRSFGKPLTAMRIDTPAGWTFTGKVDWSRETRTPCDPIADLSWSVETPDKQVRMRDLPGAGWVSRNAGVACRIGDVWSIEDYLRALVLESQPDAFNLSFTADSGLLDRDRDRYAEMAARYEDSGWTSRRAGGLIRYTVRHGDVDIDAVIIATAFFAEGPAPEQLEGGEPETARIAFTTGGIIMAAEKDKLDIGLARKVWESADLGEQWDAQVQRVASGDVARPVNAQ